ncbi:phosphatidylethanolamine-binding protein [Mycena rosella]|uniref:Phosphatidylethanolamine-binding protein n=1 Tax=Mycena rosella TaxID=1033263 RepID=A0AAD7DGN1_MYCRO|nr:phosphatidylethanolamine-binding protein [Mycena rosella]
MFPSRIASILALALFTAGQDVSIGAVDKAFCAAKIPENLTIVFKPTALLEVSLPQASGRPITLHAGIHVPLNDTTGPPTFHVVGNVGKGPFVVAAVDPDAASPFAQVRHFLGGNFFNHGGLLVNSTPVISDFVQPAPPAGSGAHRYTFLLFKQSPEFATQTLVNSTTAITGFNISQFASAVDLGKPIAGTFMLVALDA